jgi:hypothetical protein
MAANEVPVYQIKVTLDGIRPPIWRRILVRSDTTLGQLHPILQVVMGWADYHLHQFIVEQRYYGVPDPDYPLEMHDETGVKLNEIVPSGKSRFRYEYDFGDSWLHTLLVEKVLAPEPGQYYPVCIKGKRACPPEDVGGIWGYGDFLEAVRTPDHPEHEDMLEWVGGEFDSEAFDLRQVNEGLRALWSIT